MQIEKFIKTQKTFFAVWSIWMLINFALWATPGSDKARSYFYPFVYFGQDGVKAGIGQTWDFPEVLIYGIGPLLLFIIYQEVVKDKLVKG